MNHNVEDGIEIGVIKRERAFAIEKGVQSGSLLGRIVEQELGMKALWNAAMRFDKIENDVDARFVVFSDENPFVVLYDSAVRRLRELHAELSRG